MDFLHIYENSIARRITKRFDRVISQRLQQQEVLQNKAEKKRPFCYLSLLGIMLQKNLIKIHTIAPSS